MTISEFLQSIKGELHNHTSELSPLFEKVLTQALRHTTRSDMAELHDIARPSEDEAFTNWRKDNRRHLTPDFINQYIMMLQRIVKQSFNFDYDYPKLERFVCHTIIPLAIQDPNSIVIRWPYIEGVDGAPDLNGDNTTKISTKEIIVYSRNIKEINDDILIYNYDFITLNNEKKRRYIGIDKQNYYIINPYYDNKNSLKYREEFWYRHELKMLPICKLPGIVVNHYVDGAQNPMIYNESIAWPAFENFDEGVIRLSSEQVASIKHANPKLIMNADIKCTDCHGAKNIYDENKKAKPCKTCNGTGTLQALGDFSTVKIENGKGDFDKSHSNPLYYLEPPQGLEYLRKSWKEFFQDGQKAICSDPLEGTGNESGIAKEMRLEPKQDRMQSFGLAISWFVEDLVNFKRLLENEGELITVTPPVYYQTKNPEILKLDVVSSLPGERYMKFVEYIDSVFKGNEIKIKSHKFAALYAPLILYKSEEIDSVFNAGAYDERDIKRRDMAMYAMSEVISKNPKIELKEAKEEADKLLISEGFLSDPVIIDGQLDVIGDNKLLQTVGGVTSIVEVSRAVASGEMTEKAAENLLITVFGMSPEDAAKLIEVPEKKIDISLQNTETTQNE